MKNLYRVPIIIAITLGSISLLAYGIIPEGVFLWNWKTKNFPKNTWLVPRDLTDVSVSVAPGTKLFYLGYEFEVPWTDLDPITSKFYPAINWFGLTFRSGLVIQISASPAKSLFVNEFATGWKTSPQSLERLFGYEAMKSDYDFLKSLYDFSPDRMQPWSMSPTTHLRDELRLKLKSTALLQCAETGIFNLRTDGYRGFQQGNPEIRPDSMVINLYSNEGGFQFVLIQKDYVNPTGITQREINRIVQTLRKAPGANSSRSAN